METSALGEAALRLRTVSSELHAGLRDLACVDRLIGPALLTADGSTGLLAAELAMDDAERSLRAASDRTGALLGALSAAERTYSLAERAAHGLWQEVSAFLAYGVGRALPLMLPFLAPIAVGVGAGILLSPAREALAAAFSRWAMENSTVVSDPAFVIALRTVVGAVDDFGAGLIGAPPELQRLAGDEGLGLVGLATAARVVLGIANRAGALEETRVSVEPVGAERPTEPPSGWRDRAARIPQGEVPIRIDRYTLPGEPDRFEVYIAGTQDFSPVAGDDPFDMTSNLSGVAGLDSGSERAVRQAMEQAGIGPGDPVVLSGHSQGGLVAASIAASGDYSVSALFTLGAPAAEVPVPAEVQWIAVEHDDDLVPALGGNWRGDDAVIVRRRVFDGEPDREPFAPAHRRDRYVETARLLDGSADPRVTAIAEAVDPGSGARGTSRLYDARRV